MTKPHLEEIDEIFTEKFHNSLVNGFNQHYTRGDYTIIYDTTQTIEVEGLQYANTSFYIEVEVKDIEGNVWDYLVQVSNDDNTIVDIIEDDYFIKNIIEPYIMEEED